MNKKRIKQMNTLLLRRLNKRPEEEYFEGHEDLSVCFQSVEKVQQILGFF